MMVPEIKLNINILFFTMKVLLNIVIPLKQARDLKLNYLW
jgi:hypothetical protein